MRRKYNNMRQEMQGYIDAANAALNDGNQEEYRKQMDKANALKPKLEQLKADIDTLDAFTPPVGGPVPANPEAADDIISVLNGGGRVSLAQLRAAVPVPVQNAVTLSAGTTGTGVSPIIRGGDRPMSDIIPRTNPEDMQGLGAVMIPYVKTEIAAASGSPVANSGKDRGSQDPAFGYVKLVPHEVTITTYVDKKFANLTPAKYAAKILALAERARVREINRLIMLGDGEDNPEMQGIVNSVDKDGNSMVVIKTIDKVDETTLPTVVFSYGGNEDLGYNPELHLHKDTLEAFASISGINEKGAVYKVIPDGSGSTGFLSKGDGVPVRYVIDNNMKPIATAAAGEPVLAYGDPINYSRGVFDQATVHLDYSYKAAERLITILVDDMTAGGVTVANGWVVFNKAAAMVPEGNAEQEAG